MLTLQILEIITRLIPEGIGFILLAYILSRTQIDKNRLLIAGLIHAVIVFFIRMLPIHFGVHTILSLMLIILISTQINRINVLSSIISTLVGFISLFLSEAINIYFVVSVLNVPINAFTENLSKKIIYSFPSLVLFYVIILIIFLIRKKTKTKTKNIDGTSYVND